MGPLLGPCHLHVVANDSGAASTRGRRMSIRVGRRQMAVGLCADLNVDFIHWAHLLAQLLDLAIQPRGASNSAGLVRSAVSTVTR